MTKKNLEIKKTETEKALLKLNASIYPLEVIYSASYIMMDKAYILLDGNPKTYVLVEIEKKYKHSDVKELIQEFKQELLNYAVYKVQSEKNKRLNELFLEKILLVNNPSQLVELYKELKKKIDKITPSDQNEDCTP